MLSGFKGMKMGSLSVEGGLKNLAFKDAEDLNDTEKNGLPGMLYLPGAGFKKDLICFPGFYCLHEFSFGPARVSFLELNYRASVK